MPWKNLILATGLVLTIGCSASVVKPPPLPIPATPQHQELSPEELRMLRACLQGDCILAADTLRKILFNYQRLLAAHGECVAIVKSAH